MSKTTVVHCAKEPFDVYIGRPHPRFPQGSPWANPFRIGRDGARAEVVKKHMDYLFHQPELLSRLEELRGKRLGCWCRASNQPHGPDCHGDNYVRLLEGIPQEAVQATLF